MEYDEYMRMMAKRIHEVDEEEELRRSFKIFDKDGKVPILRLTCVRYNNTHTTIHIHVRTVEHCHE